MPEHFTTRPLAAAERTQLERAAHAAGGPLRRAWRAATNAFVVWVASLLLVFVLWLSVAWPARVMGGRDIGLQSAFAPWIVAIGVPLCTLYAAVAAVRWLRSHPAQRPAIEADLARGEAVEESHRFVDAKRFQEPEHGGLIYFLRARDDRVFVVYDSESQDRGARDLDPLQSAFRARSELKIVRAPRSGIPLGTSFAGEPLAVGEPIELTASPADWPEGDAYCSVPWTELERRFGSLGDPAATAPEPRATDAERGSDAEPRR